MNKKNANEIFIQKLQRKYDNSYDLIGNYLDKNVKPKIIHKKCGHSFSFSPSHVIGKNAPSTLCPNCRKEESLVTKMIEVKKRIHSLVGDEYIVEGTKKVSRTVKIKHNIETCGHEFTVNPYDFINKGTRCSKCAGLKRRTDREFKDLVHDLVGNEYKVLGEYINSTTPILMKHLTCNETFEIKPTKFIHRDKRCTHCSMENKVCKQNFLIKTTESYGEEYMIMDEYINYTTKLRIKHNVDDCGKVFERTPEQFIKYKRVCSCVPKKKRIEKGRIMFLENLQKKFRDEYVLAGKYTSIRYKLPIQHECGLTFYPVGYLLLTEKQKCPSCYKYSSSKGEERVCDFLNTNEIPFYTQYYFEECRDINPLKFDFAIPLHDNKLILIEYDGEQHFEPVDFGGRGEVWAQEQFKKVRRRDNIKNQFATSKGISLIRIPYTDFANIESILTEKLLSGNNKFL